MSVYVGMGVHCERSQGGVDGPGWRSTRQPERAQRRGAEPGRDRRLAAGPARGVRGGVRLGGRWSCWRTTASIAPGAPTALQGHRLGSAEERQGPRGDPGSTAAYQPAARGVDCPVGGAGGPAPQGPAGPVADPAATGSMRSSPNVVMTDRPGAGAGRAWLAALQLPAVSRAVIEPATDDPPPLAGLELVRPCRFAALGASAGPRALVTAGNRQLRGRARKRSAQARRLHAGHRARSARLLTSGGGPIGAAMPPVDGLPVPVVTRQVTPYAPCMGTEQDPVDHPPVIVPPCP
jgi:hypothetical protein